MRNKHRYVLALVVCGVCVSSAAAQGLPTTQDCLEVPGLPATRFLAPSGALTGGALGALATVGLGYPAMPVVIGIGTLASAAGGGFVGAQIADVVDSAAKAVQRRTLGCYAPGGPFGLVENSLRRGAVVGLLGVVGPAGLWGPPEGLLGVVGPAGLWGPPEGLLGVGAPAGLFNETLRRSVG